MLFRIYYVYTRGGFLMVAIIAKWGNGLGLHIPQYVAKEIGLENGTPVDIKIVDGAIVVKPRTYCSIRTFRSGNSGKSS